MTESLAPLLFLCSVLAVFVLAALALAKRAVRLARKLPPPSRGALRAERAVLALAALGVACILYGRFVEPYRLTVTHVRLESAKLAPGKRLRIAHFSDLHCEREPRLEDALADAIAAEKPDVIAFTGDSLNDEAGLPVLRRCLLRCAATAPTFAVRGNWDVDYWEGLPLFQDLAGVRELDVEHGAVRLETRAGPVWLAGAPAFSERFFEEALRGARRDELTIFLYHFPDGVLNPEARRIDLFLAGHTHGGQVALPLYGALVTFSSHGKRFESGLYREGTTWLYVNRGVGTDGGAMPRVRFLAPPELTIIDVEGAAP